MPAQKIRNLTESNQEAAAESHAIDFMDGTIGVPGGCTVDVALRETRNADLNVFFEQQFDPNLHSLINSQTCDRNAYLKHWKVVRGSGANVFKTIAVNGNVAGYVLSWLSAGRRMVGYWIGIEFCHRRIAETALLMFLIELKQRPLFARVAKRNLGSLTILRRCGFTPYAEGTFVNMYGDVCEEFMMILGNDGQDSSPRLLVR